MSECHFVMYFESCILETFHYTVITHFIFNLIQFTELLTFVSAVSLTYKQYVIYEIKYFCKNFCY
jgi:hypothetical protein